MALNVKDMDGFMPLLSTTDIKKKLLVGSALLDYLKNPHNTIECQDIGLFIDNIVPWLSNGNPKVVQNGLEVLTSLADRMEHDFRSYMSTIIQPTIDRLGDSKDATREKAQVLLLKTVEKGSMSPQQCLDKLTPAFSHKNAKLREEALILFTTVLNQHGVDDKLISGSIPVTVKLLSDPTEKVRETAFRAIQDMYRHVGDRLRYDLQRKHNVPQSKWVLLAEKFDEMKADGALLPSALSAEIGRDVDEADRAIRSAPAKRLGMPLKKSQFGPQKSMLPSATPVSHGNLPTRTPSTVKKTPSMKAGQAGAMDEETFFAAFEDVPTVKLFSAKDLEEQMRNIKDTIGDDKKDWKQRADSMKKLRGIIIAGGMNYDNFFECLKTLQRPFDVTCTDLRSQVVREACITLAFLSHSLKNKFASFGEAVLLTLMNLIQNSAKVVATAGTVAVHFILLNTHSSRFIPIITTSLNHKSKDIRRASCEYLQLILQTWPVQILQKHVNILQDAIKKGIADSDPDARAYARSSYWAFKKHFPDCADVLLSSLDATYKRSLMSLSNSGSVNSLNTVPKTMSNISPRSSRSALSAEDRVTPGPRSSSAIDLQAVQRAKARKLYGQLDRQKATLPRMNKSPEVMASPERTARTRTKVSGVSQSQPSSRSGSPCSRSSYATYNRDSESLLNRQRRFSGQGIKSTGNSRDPSPQRFGGYDRSSFGSKLRGRNLHMSPTDRPRPVMAQKMLQQSREAESALADALTFDGVDSYNRTPKGKGDHSDESETGSLCSERSHESYRKASDSYSWSGSQQRLYRELWDQSIPKCCLQDIKDIIEHCGHIQWNNRKEGLIGLQQYLANGNTLSPSDLRKITDIFTKLFMDSHTKVFSLFLDTLNELIVTHSDDLGDWLYVLCARLLNKLGTELLGSVQSKFNSTLEVVRENFPDEQLLAAVMRFVTDPTQTPNSRVKTAILTFIVQIAENAKPTSLTNSAKSALARIIEWTDDPKSLEVRRHAQDAVIALYNINPSQVTMMLSELSKTYQDKALPLVQDHIRKCSTSSNPASPGTPPPRAQHSPAKRILKSEFKSEMETDDNMNQEEFYRSLRRTTAEIQNYEFERLERATTSKDSGISNMADIEERIEGLALTNSGRSSSVSSPTQRTRNTVTVNGSNDTIAGDLILPHENNGYKTHDSSPDLLSKPIILDNTIKILQSESAKVDEKIAALQDFQGFVRDGDPMYIKQHFKKLLKILLEHLGNRDLQIEVLQTFIEMLKCKSLAESFSYYTELMVLKVLTAHRFDERNTDWSNAGNKTKLATKQMEVLRVAEKCAAALATVLPPDHIIRLVSSIMYTEPYPQNMGAVKMLHRVVEHWGKDVIEPHLDNVMPRLIEAYNDLESTVRKSAVFCMVAIHEAVGEEKLKPYLSSLYGSKLKLLYIYIQRAQQAKEQSSPRSNNSRN